MARTSSWRSTDRVRTSLPTGTIIAPPTPCSSRAQTNSGSDCPKPQRIEPIMKTAMAERKISRAPQRSASQPLIGMKTARLSR